MAQASAATIKKITDYLAKHGPIVDATGLAAGPIRDGVLKQLQPGSQSHAIKQAEEEMQIVRVPSISEREDPQSRHYHSKRTYVIALPDQEWEMPALSERVHTPFKQTRERTGREPALMGTVVNRYFEWLNAGTQGNPFANWTTERLEGRKGELDAAILDADTAVKKVKLAQTRRDITHELESRKGGSPEDDFLKVVVRYSEQHGIEYDTWREMGVSADVLKRAGMQR